MQIWPESTWLRDIKLFIGFANIHWCYNWGFSKIAGPLASMLKTSELFNELINVCGIKPDKIRKKKHFENLSLRATKKLQLVIASAKKTFSHLRQNFIKAPILQHFDWEDHMWIKIDQLGYRIVRVFN